MSPRSTSSPPDSPPLAPASRGGFRPRRNSTAAINAAVEAAAAAPSPWWATPVAALAGALLCVAIAALLRDSATPPCPDCRFPPTLPPEPSFPRHLPALQHLQRPRKAYPSSFAPSSALPLLPEPARSVVLSKWPQEASQHRSPLLPASGIDAEAFPFGRSFTFAMVADMDKGSYDPEKGVWKSYLTRGVLTVAENSTFFNSNGATSANASSCAPAKGSSQTAEDASSSCLHPDPPVSVSISWGATLELTSTLSSNGRAIELSDLVWHAGRFLTVCDYTGVVFKVRPRSGEIFPRFILADGRGDEARAFKGEWMTVYGDRLLVGSHGKEWVSGGKVMARGAEWVKVIEPSGRVTSVDWGRVYQALRRATGTSAPGYLTHEAVLWHEPARKWVFLPRKAGFGAEGFDDHLDESKGTNLLIIVDEDLALGTRSGSLAGEGESEGSESGCGSEHEGEAEESASGGDATCSSSKGDDESAPKVAKDESKGSDGILPSDPVAVPGVRVLRVGPLETEWGFASLARLPGSSLMLATKVREVGDVVESKVAVFDLQGRMLLPGDGFLHLPDDVRRRKYEGVEFLGQFEHVL